MRKNSTVWSLLVQKLMVWRGFNWLFVLKSFFKMAEMYLVETSSDGGVRVCVMIPCHMMFLGSFKCRFSQIFKKLKIWMHSSEIRCSRPIVWRILKDSQHWCLRLAQGVPRLVRLDGETKIPGHVACTSRRRVTPQAALLYSIEIRSLCCNAT
jgi:hypothetical protein